MYVTKLVLNFYTQLFHRGDGETRPCPKMRCWVLFDVSQRRMSKKPYTTLSCPVPLTVRGTAPLAHHGPRWRCARCLTSYCNATCQHDHRRRGHGPSEKLHLRGGAATDDPPAVEDGPPRRPRSYPVVYSRGRLRAPKRDKNDSGACDLRLASERRPGAR